MPARAGEGPSRRDFLKKTAVMAVGLAACASRRCLGRGPDEKHAVETPSAARTKSRVVKVGPDRLMPLGAIQQPFLKSGLAEGLCRLTQTTTVADAWHAILKPDDAILLKFNQSGAGAIGTSVLLAATLVDSLVAAGWAPEKITVLEVDRTAAELRVTKPPDMRWQGGIVDFGDSGKDSFIAALEEATAIINVPFLKTHNLATMTCCLKNLSHGLIRHPARFHAGGCDPAIAAIVASEPVRSKLRLSVVNAIKTACDGGPIVKDENVHTTGTLLLGTDPVACDAVGYNILSEVRALRGLAPLLPAAHLPRYLTTARVLGLGQADAERIEVATV